VDLITQQQQLNVKLMGEMELMRAQVASLATAHAATSILGHKIAGAETEALKPVDRKVLPKPTKYGGNVLKFADFQEELKDYLHVIDYRWRRLLEVIESTSKPIDETKEKEVLEEANLQSKNLQEEFRQQLYVYLKAFTEGTTYRNIVAGGVHKVIENYRIMSEVGRSRRPEHLLELRNKANNPAAARTLAELPAAITAWEADRLYLAKVAPGRAAMPDEDLQLMLMNLCPEELRKHLKRDVQRWPTYHDILVEIHDYIARNKAPSSGAKSLTEQYREEVESDEGIDDDFDLAQLEGIPAELHPTIMALVKNVKAKSKGKGKGKGTDSSKGGASSGASSGASGAAQSNARRGKGPPSADNPCHGCGSAEHFVKDCPMNPAKGRGRNGGNAGNGMPTQAQWKSMYPGPSRPTWQAWYPGKGGGGGAQQPFQGQPMKLNFTGGDPMEFLKQNGRIAMAMTATPPESAPKHASLGSGDRWRGPSDDDCHVETPPAGMTAVSKGIRAPRVAKWKRLDTKTENKYSALQDNHDEDGDEDGDNMAVPPPPEPANALPLRGPNARRTAPLPQTQGLRKMAGFKAMCPCPAFSACGAGVIHGDVAKAVPSAVDVIKNGGCIKVFTQKAHGNLATLNEPKGAWEKITSIMDSGATVTVGPPSAAAAYPVTPGAAQKAGVMYEIADGTSIPNIGEKVTATVNTNGTIAARVRQVADVSHNLNSVRQEMKANKTVVFDSEGCFTFDKGTGETVPIDDDGVNFTVDEWVIPPDQLAEALQVCNDSGFPRPAP